jgi:hypothetical protein
VGPRSVLDAVVKRKTPNLLRESNPRTPIVQPEMNTKGGSKSRKLTICCEGNPSLRDHLDDREEDEM